MRYRSIEFANGNYGIRDDEFPLKVKAERKLRHGDPKDRSNKHLVQGEVAAMTEYWSNMYGNWCRLRKRNGDIIDVRAKDISIIGKR